MSVMALRVYILPGLDAGRHRESHLSFVIDKFRGSPCTTVQPVMVDFKPWKLLGKPAYTFVLGGDQQLNPVTVDVKALLTLAR